MTPGLHLLDTSVVLHLVRDNSLGRSITHRFQLLELPVRPLVSVVTVGELMAFARKLGWGLAKEEHLKSLLRELVIVDINRREVLEAYARVDHELQKLGRPIGQNDMWIAATAMATSALLLTTDRDFDALEPGMLSKVWIDPRPSHGSA